MPIPLPSAIEQEIAKASLAIIDLFVVDFGNGIKRYWSHLDIPLGFTVSAFVGTFEARISSIGDRTQELGPSDDTIILEIGDADRKIRELSVKYGADIFEGAKVEHHRLFPNVNMSLDYAPGEGGAVRWFEDRVEWPISFGINALQRRSLRRIQFTCPHIFGGLDCGYNLTRARGIPQIKGFSTPTTGTNNTDIFDTNNPFTNALPGWYIVDRTTNTYAEITQVVTAGHIKISNIVGGESTTLQFNVGDDLIFGPVFTSCHKTVTACKERYRYGPHRQDSVGLGDKRRAYGGFPPPPNIAFQGRVPRGASQGGGDRFTRNPVGNESLAGRVIPVIAGPFRIREVPSLYFAPAGDFQHGLFIVCEGEVYDVLQPFINGHFHDDVRADISADIDRARHDSFLKWGTWFPNGVEDGRITNAELGIMVRRAVARRASVAAATGNIVIDAYGLGIDSEGVKVGNPYLFLDDVGDGISLHGCVASRVRIETNEDTTEALSGSFDVWGLVTPLQNGISHNTGDRLDYDFTFGGVPQLFTDRPNPIQFAYAFTIDGRWGIGHPKTLIKDTSDANNFCEELVSSVTSSFGDITGSIVAGSNHTVGNSVRTFVIVPDIGLSSGALDSHNITLNEGTAKEFMATIVRSYSLVREHRLPIFTGGNRRIDINGGPAIGFDTNNMFLLLDRNFPAGKEPAQGDPFRITGHGSTRRFEAIGAIADEAPAGEVLQAILDNCNGTFRTDGQNLEFIIRRGLSNAEIAAIEARGIFTDRGTNPNIIRDDQTGISSLEIYREDSKQIPNDFSVQFFDRESDYIRTTVQVFSEEAQLRAAKRFGETGDRRKISEQLTLNLTSTRDQAARLLALRAREVYIQNLFCNFQTSVKLGLPILVGDIIALDSEMFSMFDTSLVTEGTLTPQGNLLFRVLRKVEESQRFVYTFECQVHINGIYDDSATEFGEFFIPSESMRPRGGPPAHVKPETPTETVVQGSGGEPISIINVKITWPGQ